MASLSEGVRDEAFDMIEADSLLSTVKLHKDLGQDIIRLVQSDLSENGLVIIVKRPSFGDFFGAESRLLAMSIVIEIEVIEIVNLVKVPLGETCFSIAEQIISVLHNKSLSNPQNNRLVFSYKRSTQPLAEEREDLIKSGISSCALIFEKKITIKNR